MAKCKLKQKGVFYTLVADFKDSETVREAYLEYGIEFPNLEGRVFVEEKFNRNTLTFYIGFENDQFLREAFSVFVSDEMLEDEENLIEEIETLFYGNLGTRIWIELIELYLEDIGFHEIKEEAEAYVDTDNIVNEWKDSVYNEKEAEIAKSAVSDIIIKSYYEDEKILTKYIVKTAEAEYELSAYEIELCWVSETTAKWHIDANYSIYEWLIDTHRKNSAKSIISYQEYFDNIQNLVNEHLDVMGVPGFTICNNDHFFMLEEYRSRMDGCQYEELYMGCKECPNKDCTYRVRFEDDEYEEE